MSTLTRAPATISDHGGVASAIHMPAMANRNYRLNKQETVRRHTKFVRRLRLLLPVVSALLAVSILALALVKSAFPTFDLGNLSFDGGGLVMTNPRLAGHSEKGRAYVLEAATATQPLDDPDTINLEKIKAFAETSDDDEANLTAATGVFKTAEEFLILKKDIVVVTKSGYTIRTQAADIDLKAGTLDSSSEVTIVSEQLDLRSDTAKVTDQGKVIKFKGNVKIIWQRKQGSEQ